MVVLAGHLYTAKGEQVEAAGSVCGNATGLSCRAHESAVQRPGHLDPSDALNTHSTELPERRQPRHRQQPTDGQGRRLRG